MAGFRRSALLVIVFIASVHGDFFQTYFNQKQFGENPGPCVNYGDCVGDIANVVDFPDSIKNIEVCLLEGFICQTLEEWSDSGLVTIWEVQCNSLAVADIDLNLGAASSTSQDTRLTVSDVEQACSGKVEFNNAVFTYQFFIWNVRVEITTKDCCSANGGIIWTSDNQGNADALNLAFDIDFNVINRVDTPADETLTGFPNYIVNEIVINNCDMDLNLGLAVFEGASSGLWDEFSLAGIPLTNFATAGIVRLLIGLLEGLFGSTVCALIEQFDYLSDTDSGPVGPVNDLLEQANDLYDTYKEPVTVNVLATDTDFAANPGDYGVTGPQLADSLRFDTSLPFEVLSVTLNDFLGGDDGNGDLVINEAIRLLTDPDGQASFDVSEFDIQFAIPINVADVTIKLESVSVVGLDKISSLTLLDNAGKLYTVDNAITIGAGAGIGFSMNVLLERGDWVTVSSCGTLANGFNVPNCDDTEEFTFTFEVTTSGDLDIAASILSAFNIDEISSTYLGQIINEDFVDDLVGGLQQAVQCVAPAVYQLNFTDLSATLAGYNPPSVTDLSGPELSALVAASATLIDKIFEATLAVDLEHIIRGPVRDEANSFLKTEVTDVNDLSGCLPFEIPAVLTSRTDYLVFNELPVSGIFPVINDVLGATGSTVDINSFLQVMLEYFSDNSDGFPLQTSGVDGDWELKPEYLVFARLPAYRTAFSSGEAYIEIRDFLLVNLNTINTLGASATGPYGFDFNFSIGDPLPEELGFSFVVIVKATEIDIDEEWLFTIKFSDLTIAVQIIDFLIDYDLIKLLQIGQLSDVNCLLSVVESIEILDGEVLINSLDFDLDRTSYGNSDNTPFGIEAAKLESEISGVPSIAFTTMLNTVVSNSFLYALENLEGANLSALTPINCEDEENIVADTLDLIFGVNVPNLTGLTEQCLEDVDEITEAELIANEKAVLGYVTSPNELGSSFFDFQNSLFIDLIRFFVGGSSNGGAGESTLNEVLVTIANSTGNPLSEILILEDDGTTVSLELPLNETNPIFDLFGIPALKIESDAIVPGLTLQASVLRVLGINKIVDNYRILDPIGNFTTRNSINFPQDEALQVEVTGLLIADSTFQDPGATFGDAELREDMLFTLELKGLQIDLDVLFAMNTDKFVELSVGHFFDANAEQEIFLADSAVDCLFSTLFPYGFNIPQFRLNISEVSGPEFSTANNVILSEGLEGVINQTTILLKLFYLDALPNICQNCIREVLNDQLNELYEGAQIEGTCPEVIQHNASEIGEENQIYRFNTSSAIIQLQDLLNTNFYVNDFALWNDVMATLTAEEFFQDEFYYVIDQLGLRYNGEFYGNLSVGLEDLLVGGLDTFTGLEIVAPVTYDSFTTRTSIAIEGPLSLSARYSIIGDELFQEGPLIVNEPELTLEIQGLTFGIELYLELNITTALEIRFSSISSFDEIPCLLVPVNALELRAVNFSTQEIYVSFTCSGRCDSPLLSQLITTGSYESDNGEELSGVIDFVFNYTRDYLSSSAAQDVIDTGIATAEETCAEILGLIEGFFVSGAEDLDAFQFFGYTFLGFSFLGAMGVAALFPLHKKRKKAKWAKFAGGEKERELRELQEKALIWHPATPMFMRFFIPAFCLMNIVFLFWSILFSAAFKIILIFEVVGLKVNEITLVPFTIISSINDFWNSGAWPLALLVGIASCAWPIVKNTILMIIFFLPTTLLSAEKRSWYLELLDIMGKWSLLDVFVVVMTLAGLKTYVVLSQQARLSFLDDRFFASDATVAPQRGIVLLCFVAASSLIINHIQAWYHIKAVQYNHKKEDEIKGTVIPIKTLAAKESVWKYKFIPNRKNSSMRVASRRATRVLQGVNVFSGLIVLIASFLPLITFDLDGLLGLLLAIIDEPLTKKSYSLFDLGVVVSQAPQNNFYDTIVVLFFQSLFFLTGMVFPLLMVLMNSVLFTGKFTLKEHKLLMFVAMIVSFWAALECFMVGVVVTVIEIGQITKFIVDFVTDDICSNVEGLLTNAIGEKDGKCLGVVGAFGYGAPFLILAVMVQLACSTMILVFSNAVIQDRYYKRYRGKRDDAPPRPSGFPRRKIMNLLTIKVKNARSMSTTAPGTGTRATQQFPAAAPVNNRTGPIEPFPVLAESMTNPTYGKSKRKSVDTDFF